MMITKSIIPRNFRLQFNIIPAIVMVFFLVFVWLSTSHAKVQLPVSLELSLASDAQLGNPVNLEIKVTCKTPINDGLLGLEYSGIDNKPVIEQVLWEGQFDQAIIFNKIFVLPSLKEGKYHVKAWFTFRTKTEGARLVGVARNLFIDVRTDKILSSNVSFKQIRRKELKKKLEERNLEKMSKDDLKANHPDLAEEIENLNIQDSIVEEDFSLKQGRPSDVSTNESGEPNRTPTPPAPGSKPTTEEPILIQKKIK